MKIQECEVQAECHAKRVEQELLKPESKYVCGWRGVGTVENCPRLGKFTEAKGENNDAL